MESERQCNEKEIRINTMPSRLKTTQRSYGIYLESAERPLCVERPFEDLVQRVGAWVGARLGVGVGVGVGVS